MFERFTERARQVVVLAQDEARQMKHDHNGTEHLLLGLIREEEGLAARVLASLGLKTDIVRAEVLRIVGPGEHEGIYDALNPPFTMRAKKVLELGLREALSLGHNYIGTEHILLGLVRENEGVAARILLDFDADADKVRNEIIRLLSGPGRHAQPEPQVPIDEQILKVRAEKERLIEEQQFVPAAALRNEERRLVEKKRVFEAQPAKLDSVSVYRVTLNGSTFYFLPDGSRLVTA